MVARWPYWLYYVDGGGGLRAKSNKEATTSVDFFTDSLFSYTTKYVYIKSTTVYDLSSEQGLSQPLSRQRVCPSPQNRGGTLAYGWGVGGVPIPTTGEMA